ncbi:MAG: ABC transporter permease [Actinomycetota bacterium]|nr:ABC transporter permease [Actinomycetota bacterium]
MTDLIVFALLGLATGAIAALIGLGVLVGYRGSGVINFAQGAVAMYIAYVFYSLRVLGTYPLPIPGLPGFIHLGAPNGLSAPIAVVLSLATAVVLGVLMHLLVFRPLRHAPALAKVAASVGIMILLQAAMAFRFGTNTQTVPSLIPSSGAFSVGHAIIPWDRVILTVVVIVLSVGLWALFRYSRFGLSVRGAAENEKAAILLGFSPDRQASLNWILASLLAGLGGILVAPIINLTPTGLTLEIIPALAATLVARFSSFGVMSATALVLGMAQGELQNLPSKLSWWPSTGSDQLLPFLVIVVALFLVGNSLPSRGAASEGRLPAAHATRPQFVLPAVATAIAVVMFFTLSAGYRLALVNSVIGAFVCLSLVVITGFLGTIALCQMTIAGVAAYLLAALAQRAGIPFPLSPLLACLGATVVGLAIAIPALRVRGISLAVITLGAGWAIEEFFFNNPTYTGGVNGTNVPAIHILGLNVAFSKGSEIAQPAFGVLAVIILALIALGVMNLRRSPTGRRFLAVRGNERAAAAAGVDVKRMKFLGFGLASFIAGIAGCFVAYQQTLVSQSSFDILVSVSVLAIAYIGGITSVSGAMIGGALSTGGIVFYFLLVVVLGNRSNGLEIEDLISGLGLILTAILNPEGIAGAMRITKQTLMRRLRFGPPSARGGVPVLAKAPVQDRERELA